MDITDAQRHKLHQHLIENLGDEDAATLMAHLPPVGWADVATKTDLAHLETLLRSETDRAIASVRADLRAEMAGGLTAVRAEMATGLTGLRGEMHAGFAELRAEIHGLRTETQGEFAGVRSEFADVRREIGELRAEMHKGFANHLRVTLAAHVGIVAAVVGLVAVT
ncbi:MAG TPA: hypothetical protein VK866_09605 [Acidimicrobiales bacterium]|nr:hypothetical protein [Acidimicrobiales bacterium]